MDALKLFFAKNRPQVEILEIDFFDIKYKKNVKRFSAQPSYNFASIRFFSIIGKIGLKKHFGLLLMEMFKNLNWLIGLINRGNV